jgi:hypothetical protein
MRIPWTVAGLAMIAAVLWDAFETIVLPRRVTRRFKLTRTFYRAAWIPFAALVSRMTNRKRREILLSFFGPLSLLFLLSVWALGLILGFAIIQWAARSPLNIGAGGVSFASYCYMSGVIFFTLGFGDVVPMESIGRVIAVFEAGTGFGFLAIIIGYLPVIYQAFSRREVSISLLDARAGSPPTALELLRRHSRDGGMEELRSLLRDWEKWSAELLESHLSYGVLCFYRSQHTGQSWLAALAALLDVSSLIIVGIDGTPSREARLTFAMARHAVVDLAQIFSTAPRPCSQDRLPPADLLELRRRLRETGLELRQGALADKELFDLRAKYEPYLSALSGYLLMDLPPWMLQEEKPDNWQVSAWERPTGRLRTPPHSRGDGQHF